MIRRLRFVFPLLLIASWAHADTLFKCVDDDGRITYTNQKTTAKNCKILSQDQPVSTFAPPKPRTGSASGTATPGDFPRISANEQKARDNDRRAILERELDGELKALDTAKQALAEQENLRLGDERNYQKVLDRLQPYKDKVQLHERNVEALRKELGNLR